VFTASTPALTATVGSLYSYAFTASGNPTPTFALAAGAPTWLSLDPRTGAVSGTPPPGTTVFIFAVVASNGVNPEAVTPTYRISVLPPQVPPVISSPGSATFTSGRGGTFTVTTWAGQPRRSPKRGRCPAASPSSTTTTARPPSRSPHAP
jgi:hypothetical protein